MGTLLAQRGAEADYICHRMGVPWITKQPCCREEQVSISHLEFQVLCALARVKMSYIGKFEFGAYTKKPTTLLAGEVPSATSQQSADTTRSNEPSPTQARVCGPRAPAWGGKYRPVLVESAKHRRGAEGHGTQAWPTKGAAAADQKHSTTTSPSSS